MVISNNQDSHDGDKGGKGGDPNDDADADDTIIFLSPWPPVATHPPLLARHWAICDEFIDYRAYHDHHDYHLLPVRNLRDPLSDRVRPPLQRPMTCSHALSPSNIILLIILKVAVVTHPW